MKFPFTPDYLDAIPNNLVRLQNQLNDDVIADICRRMRLSGEMTESAIHQIMILQRQGLDLKDIEKRIAATSKRSQKEIEELFDRAVQRNQEYYDYTISKANIVPPVDAAQRLATQAEAIRRQTLDEFNNITQSMGFAVNVGGKTQFLPIAKAYQQTLDNALMKVSSGAFDYNTAIKGAVDELANSGLRYTLKDNSHWVDYASGRHNRIEVAARRSVMTGVSQLTGRYAEQTAEEIGTDLFEVTAHAGARDTGKGFFNHKLWQGKVYSMSGKSRKYPSLVEVCGYGLGGGLMGWNCRHSMFSFLDGVSERTYTDEQLKNIDPPPVTYQGREYNAYQATQMQRKLETAIRDTKRRMVGYNAAGLTKDHTIASIRLQRLQAEYKKFSEAAGLRRQPGRYRVAKEKSKV